MLTQSNICVTICMQRDLHEVTKPTKIVLIEVTKPTKIVLIEVTKPTKIEKEGIYALFLLKRRNKYAKMGKHSGRLFKLFKG